MAIEGNTASINDGSSNVSGINSSIRLIENEINELINKINLIKQGINNISNLINQSGTTGTNVISQAYESLNWLKNNIDEFWIDMHGSKKKQVVDCYEKLCNQSKGPIGIVTSSASQVVSDANKKIDELKNKLEELRNEKAFLEAKISNSGTSTGGGAHLTEEQNYKLN